MEAVEHRLKQAEDNIRELFREVKALAILQERTSTTLDNLNITLRELKGAVLGLQTRPGGLWDKVIHAIITAVVAAGVAAVVGGLIK